MRIEGVEGDGQDHEARGFERESVELSIKRSKRIDGHIYIYIFLLGNVWENYWKINEMKILLLEIGQRLNMLIILDNLNNRRKKFNEKWYKKRIPGGTGRQGDRNSRHNRMGERRGKKKKKRQRLKRLQGLFARNEKKDILM